MRGRRFEVRHRVADDPVLYLQVAAEANGCEYDDDDRQRDSELRHVVTRVHVREDCVKPL
nr:hypothetical protein [Haloarcula hispanica]